MVKVVHCLYLFNTVLNVHNILHHSEVGGLPESSYLTQLSLHLNNATVRNMKSACISGLNVNLKCTTLVASKSIFKRVPRVPCKAGTL